jgi:hypothetical protein
MAKKMAKSSGRFLNFIAWLTGILVSLSVGFAMVEGTLSLPTWLGGDVLAMIVGWIVVVTTLISVIMAILNK